MKELVVLIPIYRERLLDNEIRAVDSYCNYFKDYDLFFVCATSLNTTDTQEKYPQIDCVRFNSDYFKNNKSYNALMFDVAFYERFKEYKNMLVAQTDAIIFNPNIDIKEFLDLNLDYIGAPWYESPLRTRGMLRYVIKRTVIHDSLKMKCGNGGFSLRNVTFCMELLQKTRLYRKMIWSFNEDLFFSYVGWKKGYQIAEVHVAEKFCLEQNMVGKIIEGVYPLALHAWEKEVSSYEELMSLKKE